MPTEFAALDTGFPSFTGRESTEQKVTALHNYVFMLLENLRYLLRNLSPENFNEADRKAWEKEIRAGVVVSNTVITNELYADYGAIADLTVDALRTDYARAARYPDDTSDLDYISVHDGVMQFITASVLYASGSPLEEQLVVDGVAYYWKDSAHTQMTGQEVTAWPVIVYQYEELIKAEFSFINIGGYATPRLTLGAGTGDTEHPDAGKAFIYKASDGLHIQYNPTNVSGFPIREIYFDNNGNITVDGPLSVADNLSVTGNLTVQGAAGFGGLVTFAGGTNPPIPPMPEPDPGEGGA